MGNDALHEIADRLVAKGKGILAADESSATCGKRFQKYGIPETPEMRRKWRNLLFTTPEAERHLSGVILYDETIRQRADDGTPFPEYLAKRGIISGIKVDGGIVPMQGSPEEKVTEGLEGLPERLKEYARLGAKFTKWRSVIWIGDGLPSEGALYENTARMVRYAAESQAAGLVPIVEPEVLLDGRHTIERCEVVLKETLAALFAALRTARVDLRGLILKTSMVLPGKDGGTVHADPNAVAERTLRALRETVPSDVAGVVFLSGGQTPSQATENLNEMAKRGPFLWPLTFSYSRALQEPALEAWAGKEGNVKKAQDIFLRRVVETAEASEGKYQLSK